VTSKATVKTAYLKVRMSYGTGPTTEDFAVWSADVDTYIATPEMEVKGLHNSGSLEVSSITVEMPEGTTFVDALVRGVPFPPIFLYVTEVVTSFGPSGSATEEIKHAIGDYKLVRATKNPDKRQGFCRLEFEHHKRRPARVRLGMAANPGCSWTLGDKSCQITPVAENATIAAIDGKKVTLTDPTDLAVVDGRPIGDFPYWYRGSMEIDGLFITIRDWVDGSYEFQLEQEPPADWLGALVALHPGCGKTLNECRTKWTNEEHFGGFGVKIPSYDPGLELS